MFIFDARTLPPAPDRVLKPEIALAYRAGLPVTTRPWRRFERALSLAGHYFGPEGYEAMRSYASDWREHDWLGGLRVLCSLVDEAGWWELPWETLDYFWEVANNAPGEDEVDYPYDLPDGLAEMADYLDGLPVRFYGWDGSDSSFVEDIGRYPPMRLLSILCAGPESMEYPRNEYEAYKRSYQVVLPSSRRRAGKEPGDIQRDIYQALTAYETLPQPEPLCWLPELARYTCGLTGNPLLDETIDLWDYYPTRFTWDKDVELVRELYAGARVVREHMAALCVWAQDGDDEAGACDEARLNLIFDVVMEVVGEC